MALIKCPECGKEISNTIDRCIHCGYILDKTENYNNVNKNKAHKKTIKNILFIVGSSLIIIIIGLFLYNYFSDKRNDELNSQNKWANAKYSNLYFQNGYVEAQNPSNLNISLYTPDYKYIIDPIYLGAYAHKTTTVSNADRRNAKYWKPLDGYEESLSRVDLIKYSKEEIEEYWYGKKTSNNGTSKEIQESIFQVYTSKPTGIEQAIMDGMIGDIVKNKVIEKELLDLYSDGNLQLYYNDFDTCLADAKKLGILIDSSKLKIEVGRTYSCKIDNELYSIEILDNKKAKLDHIVYINGEEIHEDAMDFPCCETEYYVEEGVLYFKSPETLTCYIYPDGLLKYYSLIFK